ncbi:MAG: trypsin-like peptidase domain-containing protein [Phycisphaerae bacterium]|nr:trypsin-like peptidase domain-containing protein [Phycisphaerae bacterium]
MQSFGPGLVVLAAAGAALLIGPLAVKEFVYAQTSVDIVQASARLQNSANLLEQINAAQRDIAQAVEPSVVHVSTAITVARRSSSIDHVSSGSGWIFDDLGHIVTNGHVVDGAARIQVQLHDGSLREAKVVGLDLRTDIAVVKIDSGGLHAARRGNSDDVQQGDLVYAFGSPFDFRFSMSSGIVSGLGRTAGPTEIDYQNFIQVDAAINPGNSGGPLTDIYGRVIGMNTAIATGRGNSVGQGQFAGIGLAIPMSMIESVVTQIIESGEVRKGYLGISFDLRDADPATSPTLRYVFEHFNGEGAPVTLIESGSPAAESGLRVGDVLLAIDGRRINTPQQVRAVISSKHPGTSVILEVWRPELETGTTSTKEFKVTLGMLDPARAGNPNFMQTLEQLGLTTLATSTEDRAKRLGVPFRRGVIVEDVRAGSLIEEAIPVGSIITAILGQPVGSEDEFYTRVNRFVRELRQGQRATVGLPISYVTPQGEERQNILPYLLPQPRRPSQE